MRTLVIGDIHGAYKALEQVLERAAVTISDRLIFLGDYVDGWSESAAVMDLLLELELTHNCIFIRGNHDVWLEDWLATENTEQVWYASGGKSTIESYRDYSSEQKTQHLAFLNQLKNYFVDEQNRLFIHAGFSSMHGPEQEFYSSNYRWDRTLWEMVLTMDRRVQKDSKLYPRRLKLFSEIFIGHTPTVNYDTDEPMNAINVWNIDTGAAFNGRLSIMDVETKQYWQSDIVQTLYPKERGRNKG